MANVAIWGERLQMMQVQVEPTKMEARDVALDDVMEATADAVDSGLLRFSNGSIIGTGGTIVSPNQQLNVRNVLPIITPKDLAEVPLRVDGKGQGTKLGDVAHLVEDHQPLIGDAVINDSPGLLLVVEKLPWANTVEMTKGVEEAIRSLEPGLPGVQFDTTIFQQANFIEAAIHNLTQALLLGFVLVVVILALFLFEWRVAVISVLTIPLSLMATLLVLHWRGETINTMTLAGLVIALGAVVDDAIIDVENIVRRLRQHRLSGSEGTTASVILNASLEVRSPIVYATLIIVAAAVPVFLLSGLTGAFFRPWPFPTRSPSCRHWWLPSRSPRRSPCCCWAGRTSSGGSRPSWHAPAEVHARCCPESRSASPGVRHCRTGQRRRHRTDSALGSVALPGLQGARLSRPLGQPAGYVGR